MSSKKILLSAIVMFAFCASAYCAELTLDDLIAPKEAAYRVGISEIPENQYIEAQQERTNPVKTAIKEISSENTDTTYADLSIKRLSREVSQDLEYEEQDMVADLSLLWQGAAMQSDTINFALYKLANPDADKPEKGAVKKMLQTIASVSSLAGAGLGNPLLAGTSLIGGNVLGIMSQDTKALNYKYTRVTDADMIILIRKVEDLQQNAVNLYYDYMTAKNQLDMVTKLVQERRRRFETAQSNNAPKELIVITDAYYRTALDKQRSAKSEFYSKRAALEQFVGNEVFTQFESELVARESARNSEIANNETKDEYSKTIQDVEDFTKNLSQEKNETANYDYNTFIYEDTNLNKVPEMEPMTETQALSEDNKNLEAENSGKTIKASKKAEKQKEKEEKEKIKHPINGLIFSHSKGDKTKAQDDETDVNIVSNPKTLHQEKNNTPKKVEKFDGVELMPLDEIRVPELTKDGYSIYSYYNE